MHQGTVRVLLVDDHRSFAEALEIAIELEPDLACVGIATTIDEAVSRTRDAQPDVVLLDVHLGEESGLDAIQPVKRVHPPARVVIITSDANLAVMAQATGLGAAGFLLKEGSVADILHAIRAAGEGEILLRDMTLATLLQHLPSLPKETGGIASLTLREREVLGLLVVGHDARRISKDLSFSIHAARGHIKSILAKLGVHSQLEAVVAALRAGFLPPGSPSEPSQS